MEQQGRSPRTAKRRKRALPKSLHFQACFRFFSPFENLSLLACARSVPSLHSSVDCSPCSEQGARDRGPAI